jgi:hypothetical protein
MKRQALRRLLLSAATIAVVSIAYRFFYFGERAVTAALRSIPGVRVRAVWGSADLIPKWYYARIDMADGSSAYLYRLTRGSFNEEGEFCFFQVGEYAVRYTAFGNFWGPGYEPQPTGGNAFCFDGSGGVADGSLDLFPVRIRGVREFVQNVRVVEGTLARWPRCPNFDGLAGARGRYRVCTNPDVSTDIWPPEHGWQK